MAFRRMEGFPRVALAGLLIVAIAVIDWRVDLAFAFAFLYLTDPYPPGWQVYGGTSVASSIIASVYALAGTPGASDNPNAYPYSHASSLFDVTTGNNGACSPA